MASSNFEEAKCYVLDPAPVDDEVHARCGDHDNAGPGVNHIPGGPTEEKTSIPAGILPTLKAAGRCEEKIDT